MTCDTYQNLLSAWLDRELSGFEEQTLHEHLVQCSHCRATWKTTRRLQEQIDGLVEPKAPPELWEWLEMELESAAKASQTEWIITARGRILTKTKGERLCLHIPFNQPTSLLSN